MSLGGFVRRTVASRAAGGPRIPDALREQAAPLSMPWHVRTLILPLADRPGLVFFNLISDSAAALPILPDASNASIGPPYRSWFAWS